MAQSFLTPLWKFAMVSMMLQTHFYHYSQSFETLLPDTCLCCCKHNYVTWHACAVRVTVVVLCVCVCVCPQVILAVCAITSKAKDTIVLGIKFGAITKSRFSL